MKVLLDTSTVVAAVRSDAGASRRLLVSALQGRIKIVASVPLMIEYEAVLTRPEHLAAAGLPGDDVGVLLDALASVVEPVRLAYLWRPIVSDPDDDMVLETTVNGGADVIVTFNIRDLEGAAKRFGIETLLPGQLIRNLELDNEKE